jgi:outer membrane cobalamin receptor
VNFNYYYYGTEKFEKPFHRPSIDLTFSNSFVIQERFVAAVDLFLLGGMYAQDSFNFNEVTKLPTIVDLNTKFDYLLSDQFTCFVQLNNLLNQNYQRFLFYPKQGLNFLVGVNVSI